MDDVGRQKADGEGPSEEDLVPGPDGEPITQAEAKRLRYNAIYCSGGEHDCTEAFADFVTAGHELTHFIGMQNAIAFRLDETLDLILSTKFGMKVFKGAPPLIDYSSSLAQYNALNFQILLMRSVDIFLVYTAKLLTTIFQARPEVLRSSGQVRIDYVLEHDSMDELIRSLADDQVSKLAYKGMRELAKEVERLIGLDMFSDDGALDRAVDAVERRNVLVHNNGVVNRMMARKVARYRDAVGSVVDASDGLEFAHSSLMRQRASTSALVSSSVCPPE